MSLTWVGTRVNAEHDVDPDQFEPGKPAAEQARAHHVDFTLLDWNLAVGLALTDWLEVQASLPYRVIGVEASFFDGAGAELPDYQSIHHRDETLLGVGDLTLSVRVVAVDPTRVAGWTLVFQTGLAVPTGHTEANPFALGRAGNAHQHMFFGNGTLDPIFGVESGHAFAGWALRGALQARIPFGVNDHGYRGPGQLTVRLHAESGLGLDAWTFFLGPEVFRETPAAWSGEPAKNSGRTDLIAAAGAFWTASERWSFFAQGRVPFTVQSEGGQLNVPFLGMLGAIWQLPVWAD